MNDFFNGTRPGEKVSFGDFTFELPILYFRDDFFGLYFAADFKKIKALMPSKNLYPITLPNGKAIIVIVAANYIDTSIGSYGEIPVVIPAVYGKKPWPGTNLLPALMEGGYPGFGTLVQHLPVTSADARDAGRGIWGYTKFIADMEFSITPEYMQCTMKESEKLILSLRVARQGFNIKDKKPMITFSVKNNQLIKTVIPQKSVKRVSLRPKGSFLKLGDHEVAKSISDLGISSKPFMSIYFNERSGILPKGEVIESGVQSFDGYTGTTREAQHIVNYT